MSSLVGHHDIKEGNRRVLKVLLGVMIFLVVFSVLTIMAKHGGINLP